MENSMKNLSLTIPLMPGHSGDIDRYLEICRQTGAERVFLFTPLDNICRAPSDVKKQYGGNDILRAYPHQESCDIPSIELYEAWTEEYRRKAERFREIGVECAYWVGETIGHGGAISTTKSPFQQLTGPEGLETQGCSCPLDEEFLSYMEQVFETVAKSGAPLILLDDDFRLNYHMPGVPVGCFCPLHIASFNQKLGKSMTREEIVAQVFSGQPSELRSLWFDHAAESMLELARHIERAVHRVNPEARLGIATAMTHWSNEGYEIADLLKALCGSTRPFLRTYGSPYRYFGQISHIGRITEFSLMQAEKLRDLDVEILAEGDTYPHTRYFCPEQLLDSYQKSLYALGFPGVLSYPVTFSAAADHESGYVRKSAQNRGHYQAIRSFFAGDFGDIGVRPLWRPNNIRRMNFDQDGDFRRFSWPDEPAGAYFLSRMGVPLNHFSRSCPVLAAGYALHACSEEELAGLLSNGMILDSVAALELLRRGIDIGVTALVQEDGPQFERYSDPAFSGKYTGENIWLLSAGGGIYYRAQLKEGTYVISSFSGPGIDGYPAAVLYENKQGQRFLLYCFDMGEADKRGTQLLYNYARQEQLANCIGWLGRKPLMVSLNGSPDLHLICKKAQDGCHAIGIHNTHLDPITDPALSLDAGLRIPQKIQLLLPDAKEVVETDDFNVMAKGERNILTVKTVIPSMGMLGIKL